MIFNEAEVLTYTSQNNFLSDGEFRYGSTKVLSINSVINTKLSNTDFSGVKESQEKLMELVSGAHNFQETIINGVNFGSGKIISINSETAPSWDIDSIRFGKNTFQIEIQNSGEDNLCNMTGNFFVGLKERISKQHLLESFSESFTFDFPEDGEYGYNHQVSAKYFSGAEVTDPIAEAKQLASGIFEQDPSFGLIHKSGFYNTDGKKSFTEAYNLQTNACSFAKNFKCKQRYKKDDLFCSNTLHSLSSDENGIITISERGEVMGLDDDGNDELYDSALNGLNTLVSSAFDRCTGVFSGYSGFYGNQADINNLNSQYLTLQKGINRISSNLSYDISFNNSANLSGQSGQHDMILSLDSTQDGVRVVKEAGTLTSFLSKGQENPNQLYNSFSIDENSPYRCGNFYSGAVNNKRNNYNFFQKDRFNLMQSSINYSVSGNKVSYEKTFTDDPTVIKTNKINTLDVSSSDVFRTDISQVFFIPNQQKEILHKRGIKTLANRSISASCIYERPSTNFWTDISYAPIGPESNSDYYDALKFVKNKMLEKAFDDGWISINNINSMFINNFNYSIGSDQNLSMTMNILYEE